MSGTDLASTPVPAPPAELVARALALVESGTTELADSVLPVPLSYYGDDELLRREKDEILAVTPLALVPSARLEKAYDFLVRDVLGTSVLVTRDGGGRAHAFLNYCRHRGARPAEGCGSARRFTCPYHAWNYDSEGQLVGLPGQEGFAEIDRGDYGLVELPSEERHGFVWVVLTVGVPIDVAAHLGPLDAELATWHLESYEFHTDRTFDSDVNWKAALEAFAENYHFAYVHANSIVGQNTVTNTGTFDRFGLHHRLGFPNPWITDVAPVDPTPLHSMVFIYWVFPNLVLAVSPVGAELIDILPGDDPVSCTVQHGWMATVPANDDETRAGYDDLFAKVHDALRNEDFAMLPSCGSGIRHGQHDHMIIGRNEPGVQNVVRAFSDVLGLKLTTD
jgi:phenylpropionate dioxygenase-like ring-hydroxylating dioxygenase large terminal subunit